MFKVGDKVRLTHKYDKHNPNMNEEFLIHENIEPNIIYTVTELHNEYIGEYIRLENKKASMDNYWLWAKHFGAPCSFVFDIEDF